ncbi:P-selectin glycoprotein ligand 1 [Cololabis saira]|uniref:P-selectin glycoprotein ligand 1 n=1 Tax=Cololabis saira TaxID=129043 RepID=UPI002AD25EA9|nr:P-selectin glycoprotein ligand 1 [Cololabis saira]
MLPSVKINVPLLWGFCVLLSGTTSIPEAGMEQMPIAHVEELQPGTLDLKTKSAEVSSATLKEIVVTTRNVDAVFSDKTHSSVSSTPVLVVVKKAATEVTSISKLLGSAVVTTAKAEGRASHISTVTDSPKHTTDRFHQPPVTSFTDRTVPAKASTATVANPLPQSISTIHPETVSELNVTTTADAVKTRRNLIQNLSNPTTSAAEETASTTSEAALHRDTTETKTSTTIGSLFTTQSISATSVLNSMSQFPEQAGSNSTSALIHDPTETVASTKHSHTPQAISTTSTLTSTSHFVDRSRSNSTSADSLNATETSSTSSAGILIPRDPKKSSVSTARPAITTSLSKTSKTTPSNPVQPCSTRSTVKKCLIVIATLAVLTTIFMVTTIVLCTKLSARKYRVRKPKQETEMMCISALLPERSNSYVRQRNPVCNGVMVFPMGGDSDDEVGDNVTLSSFLPDNV